MHGQPTNQHGERVWDPLVRLTHWVIALAVIVNGVFIDGDALAHIWIGYVALGLLALRLLWGFIGSENARFSAFPPSLSGAARHISSLLRGEHPDYRSHNPLGAWMAYGLWAMLLVVSATGVMLDSEPFPQYAAEYRSDHLEIDDGEDAEVLELIEDVHEGAANLLLLIAVLHIGGVMVESRLSGRDLVRSMISGRRE